MKLPTHCKRNTAMKHFIMNKELNRVLLRKEDYPSLGDVLSGQLNLITSFTPRVVGNTLLQKLKCYFSGMALVSVSEQTLVLDMPMDITLYGEWQWLLHEDSRRVYKVYQGGFGELPNNCNLIVHTWGI